MTAESCYCCSLPGRDKHHILPVEYGGPMKGKTVLLCKNHHDRIHRFASLILKGEKPAIPNEKERILVGYIVQQKQLFDDNLSDAGEARNMCNISMSPQELAIAHDLKRMMGMKALPRMFIKLMLQEWEKRRK